MKLTEYGPGDWQTWGGCSPYPSDDDEAFDKLSDELSDELYAALDNIGMHDLYDSIVESQAFEDMVAKEFQYRKEKAEEASWD